MNDRISWQKIDQTTRHVVIELGVLGEPPHRKKTENLNQLDIRHWCAFIIAARFH